MDCAETINLITAIGTVSAVVVALLIAIFQDVMRAWFTRPKLEVSIDLRPPDCHKTGHSLWITQGGWTTTTPPLGTTTLYPHTGDAADVAPTSPSALTGVGRGTGTRTHAYSADQGDWSAPSRTADAYYFRLRVHNSGNQKAESVEVFAAKLEEKQTGDTFGPVDSFLPMNLVWSHYRQVFLPAISPKTYKHCDLAHIIDPKERKNFPGEDKSWTHVSTEKTILSLDTVVKPYTQSYLVPEGTYHLEIVVAAANAKPVVKTLEITLTGEWYDDDQEMLNQRRGISIRFLP